ncbi:MAG: Dabb family protein [Bacteroidetes bacterium]|nr:Dabb family protein [Bacteroidota bacterium]
MIHHIVFFKFKESVKEPDIRKLEDGLGSLPARIPEIRRYELGRDVMRSDRSFDFALDSSFDDLDSLRRYSGHPEHQKVLKHINEICSSIKSVDFETNTDEAAH